MSSSEESLIAWLREQSQLDGDRACFFLDSDPGPESGWLVVRVTDSNDAKALWDELRCGDSGNGTESVVSKSSNKSSSVSESTPPPIPGTFSGSGGQKTDEFISPNSHAITLEVIERNPIEMKITKHKQSEDQMDSDPS